jgi:hypothetical protein
MFMLLPALFPAAKVRHVAVSCCSGCLSLYANFSRPSSEAPPCIIHTGSGSLRKWQRSSWMAPEASSDSSTCTSSARSRGAPRAAEERGCRQGACGSSAGDAGYGANNLVNSLLISAQPETTHETPGSRTEETRAISRNRRHAAGRSRERLRALHTPQYGNDLWQTLVSPNAPVWRRATATGTFRNPRSTISIAMVYTATRLRTMRSRTAIARPLLDQRATKKSGTTRSPMLA